MSNIVSMLPISVIVPTRNRAKVFARTLESLALQKSQPADMVVVDASDGNDTYELCHSDISGLSTKIAYYRAIAKGAAVQRNQAIQHASHPYILFCDDDILFEPDCIAEMWQALSQDSTLGGVCTLITNCHYTAPGRFSKAIFHFLNGHAEESYAGKCIGPVMNLLPEDREDLPTVVPVEWMNSTCTLYRREAMPDPPFPSNFVGYSLMEDVTLSLQVGKRWKLANVRTAKIFHDSQPGDHKNDPAVLAKMDLVNRYYVMTQVLERNRPGDYFKLLVQQLFNLAASLQSWQGWAALPRVLLAKLNGVFEILTTQQSTAQQPQS
ncbi:glycosyltransferase family A protein [Leptothoe sp. LEGE 181152]|nr:glycosyltransferase family A protein [Leptothoe sp. LEGE 181152]